MSIVYDEAAVKLAERLIGEVIAEEKERDAKISRKTELCLIDVLSAEQLQELAEINSYLKADEDRMNEYLKYREENR